MPRRSLRPELNRIRAWVRQGRTDAWIAHQLEATVQQIQAFKRTQDLTGSGDADAPGTAADYDDDIDLRAEDDAMVAAELDAAQAKRAEEEKEAKAKDAKEAKKAKEAKDAKKAKGNDAGDAEDGEEPSPRRRGRRGARSGARGRRKSAGALEATFDHGEEGYGLWLDPAVQDDPIYAEYWAGHRPVEVAIEEDQIVIRRAGGEESEDGD